jgi:Trk-type K+ transport system membrane component
MGIGLIFGALGAALWLPLRQRDWQALLTDPETLLFLALTGVFLLAVLPAGLGLADAAGWSIGALSTSGLAIAPPEATARVPLALAILPALVGGSALSAAGGFKLARLIVLAQRAGLEFRQLGFRRSVLRFDFRNRALDERSVFAVWIYIVGYIIAIFLTLVALSFFVPSLDESMRLATGAITNSGSLTRNTGGTLNEAAQAIMAFAMVLGRVEVLAFLPVFTVSFWRG